MRTRQCTKQDLIKLKQEDHVFVSSVFCDCKDCVKFGCADKPVIFINPKSMHLKKDDEPTQTVLGLMPAIVEALVPAIVSTLIPTHVPVPNTVHPSDTPANAIPVAILHKGPLVVKYKNMTFLAPCGKPQQMSPPKQLLLQAAGSNAEATGAERCGPDFTIAGNSGAPGPGSSPLHYGIFPLPSI